MDSKTRQSFCMDTDPINCEIINSIQQVGQDEWDRLNPSGSPFLRYAFLAAMEKHEAVGERFGWYPRFVIARDKNGMLTGAMPMYEKDNSYGELVFDWTWAEAYHRQGVPWYPKLVSAIPYTPATGDRLLTANSDRRIESELLRTAIEYCESRQYSSLHALFINEQQASHFDSANMPARHDIQYHWFNESYANFEEFLSGLKRDKRKKIRQERKHVAEMNIDTQILHGNEISDEQWTRIHQCYASTFMRKSGYATLSQEFFREIGKTMGEQVVVAMAMNDSMPFAAAINFRSHDTLYGRHWGCLQHARGLHFELCYYMGIEYAIEHGLRRFEPGAQGEYKMSRGFIPVRTRSAHWIVNPVFRGAIDDFLSRERRAINHYRDQLMESAPYKAGHPVYNRVTRHTAPEPC